MDSGYQSSFLPEPGYFNFGVSGGPTSSEYIDLTLPPASDPAPIYEYVSASPSSQSMSMPPYGDTFPSHSAIPNVNSRIPGYSTLPPMTSGNFTNTRNSIGAASTSLTNPGASGELARQWSNFTQSPTDHTTDNALPLSQYYFPAVSQATSPTETQFTMPPPLSFAEFQQMRNRQVLSPVLSPSSHTASAGASTANSGTTLRQSRHPQVFPQSGASTASAHQRRLQRTSTLAPTPPVPASGLQRSRSGVQPSRVRARPTSMSASTADFHIPSPQPSTPYGSRSHVSTSGSVNRQPATTTSHRSTQSTQHPSSYERLAERNARLSAILRTVHPSDVQALYEQSLAHGRGFDSEICSHKRVFDTPKESRPEPKETDELTLNMECKICMGQLVDTVLLPCGHAILCSWCADQHIPSIKGYPQGKANCPMCRDPVKQKYRIYFG
ncbi:hypothetical protein BDV12DRAFT_60481 [Aspergillus spectabilis]